MPGFFMGRRLNSRIKVQNYFIFTGKNDETLNITKVKYTLKFQIMPFMIKKKLRLLLIHIGTRK